MNTAHSPTYVLIQESIQDGCNDYTQLFITDVEGRPDDEKCCLAYNDYLVDNFDISVDLDSSEIGSPVEIDNTEHCFYTWDIITGDMAYRLVQVRVAVWIGSSNAWKYVTDTYTSNN